MTRMSRDLGQCGSPGGNRQLKLRPRDLEALDCEIKAARCVEQAVDAFLERAGRSPLLAPRRHLRLGLDRRSVRQRGPHARKRLPPDTPKEDAKHETKERNRTGKSRNEDDAWKVTHRHADPITAPRPPESVLQTV